MFDWRDYLELASSLSATGPITIQGSEAASRSAISRAYYAAYCHARNYASHRLGFVASGGSRDHGRLRAHFQNIHMRSVADSLNMLRQWRNQCDYDDVVPNLPGVLTKSLNQAESVIRQL